MEESTNQQFVESYSLHPDCVPVDANDWRKIVEFAGTFDLTSELPGGSAISGVADIHPDATIAEMRLAIYAEWRRYNHRGSDPDDNTKSNIQFVLNQLRNACRSNLAHVIFLRSGQILIAKRPEDEWRQLQDNYPDYMASFGPWTAQDIATYFNDDYTADETKWPFTRAELLAFFRAANTTEMATE